MNVGTMERAEVESEKMARAIRPFVADRHGHTAKDNAIQCRPCNTIRDSARVDCIFHEVSG
jgi:hypothetical protein